MCRERVWVGTYRRSRAAAAAAGARRARRRAAAAAPRWRATRTPSATRGTTPTCRHRAEDGDTPAFDSVPSVQRTSPPTAKLCRCPRGIKTTVGQTRPHKLTNNTLAVLPWSAMKEGNLCYLELVQLECLSNKFIHLRLYHNGPYNTAKRLVKMRWYLL